MFRKKKTIEDVEDVEGIDLQMVQVEPCNSAMLAGCYSNNVYQCTNCKSDQYIPHRGLEQCNVCGGTSLTRYAGIMQWKYGKWHKHNGTYSGM